jgi:hypothetical protein
MKYLIALLITLVIVAGSAFAGYDLYERHLSNTVKNATLGFVAYTIDCKETTKCFHSSRLFWLSEPS